MLSGKQIVRMLDGAEEKSGGDPLTPGRSDRVQLDLEEESENQKRGQGRILTVQTAYSKLGRKEEAPRRKERKASFNP